MTESRPPETDPAASAGELTPDDQDSLPEDRILAGHDALPEDGVELSLDELGRAYAKAVGLIPEEPVETQQAAPQREDPDDDAACELSPRSILEAILFVGSPDEDTPLTTRQIASWIRDVSPGEITQLARGLQAEYEQQGAAFRIERKKSSLRLVLADEYEPVRENFYGEIRKAKLSQQAIDVLAIVAYHQPATRETVNEIRGRDCQAILRQLEKRKLLESSPQKDRPRVREYRTTDRFLELFGLETIDDLPRSEDLPPTDPDDFDEST